MARIADSGWLMIGVPNSPPKTPELVRVKVDPEASSGLSFFDARALGQVGHGAGQGYEAERLGLLDHRNNQAPLESHGDAEVDVGVVVDGAANERGVDDRVAAQRLDGCRGDEGHEGELDAVLLLEAAALPLAQADDARHVDLVDGVYVRADGYALDHAVGDDGAHAAERDDGARQGRNRRRRRRWCGGRGGAARTVLAEVAEDIVPGDAAVDARPGNGGGNAAKVEVVFPGDAAHQGRRAHRHSAAWRGLRLRRWDCCPLRCRCWRGGWCGSSRAEGGWRVRRAPNDSDDSVDLDGRPASNLISVSTPATGEGISASTLSVEISNSGSSFWTVSPAFFSHLVMVPSKMDSPICGMTTSVPPIAGPVAASTLAGAALSGATAETDP